jgi:transcription-repair coupling factor (superfamily II helicase)
VTDVTFPLPSLAPPEGIVASRLLEVLAALTANGHVHVSGERGSAASFITAKATELGRHVVVVTRDGDEAERVAADLSFLLGKGETVLTLPANESSPFADVSPDRRAAISRLSVLSWLARKEPFKVLVLPVTALLRKVVPKKELMAATARVVAEDELDRDATILKLSEAGYLRVPVVEDPGTFSVRGALLDVWPPGAEMPVRVELYGDLVLSIKPFDPFEQKTLEGRAETNVWLPPAREPILTPKNMARAKDRVQQLSEMIDWPTTKTRALVEDVCGARGFFGADGFLPAYYEELDSIFAYLPDDSLFVLAGPADLHAALEEERTRVESDEQAKEKQPHFLGSSFYGDAAHAARTISAAGFIAMHRTQVLGEAEEGGLLAFATTTDALDLCALDNEDLGRALKAARATRGKTLSLAPLVALIRHYEGHGLSVFLAARTETQADRLVQLLKHQGVETKTRFGAQTITALLGDRFEETACVVTGPITRGLVLPADGFALITEEEIFGARAHRRREQSKKDVSRAFIEDLRSLSVGDFVVHTDHGIGRYQGLVHKEVGSLTVDLIVVEYSNNDRLYLPVYRLNQLQKYAGGESSAPKIDRLGGQTFSKTKARVEKAVRQMADELLKLYAERQAAVSDALPEADDDYRAFEATFSFDETPDQQKAISDVNADLESTRPMDRLVCGDVGFGKTEVAIRAAFRVASAGSQVALLCPTTVLAQQHFRTLEARLRDYPINVRVMSRFQPKKEQDETLAALKDGKCDIVVGTHRLLSKDIHLKSLGLLIVDEEQRFGVTHKERIKQMKTQVDVLTLSATPIPRTLQMAVSGLRDLSLITTPPVDRRAVRTVVSRYDPTVLKEAITRELSRGGQVFYVYNRIEGIYERAQRVQELVPGARIAVAHGQMTKANADGETALERTMLDFVDGRYDILVATAIIESGLDIPRANTIIIDRADMFGLAQLYQLRGRVGRSKERAYCYLVVPPQEAMTDESRARIEALERHTELGSGFKIASLDLELRGAGDLLGSEQSGTVESVGFELFCQMLDLAVKELRGETVVHEVDTELSFDVPALLPEDYIGDVGVRLSFYKRLASASDEAHVEEIAVEMEDRFGPPPEDAKRFVALMRLKTELRRLRALGCEASAKTVTLHLREDTPLDPQKVLKLVAQKQSPYKLTPDMRLTRRFDGTQDSLKNCETLLEALAKCLKD